MTSYVFLLRVPDRELSDDEIEALYAAGLSDAGIETGPHGTVVDVTREADSEKSAVESAVRQVADTLRIALPNVILERRL